MKRLLNFFALAAVILLGTAATDASAQANASHDVNLRVATIDAVALSQRPIELAITEATGNDAGLGLQTVSAESRFALLTNGEGRKLTVALDESLPEGIRLAASLELGDDANKVELGETAQTAFSGISRARFGGQKIEYALSADVEAGAFSGSRTVTYTLTAN
jgi:hypothetical protein